MAYVELTRGRVVSAARWAREATAVFRGPSRVNYLPATLATLAYASALTGDLRGAEAALQEAEAAHTEAVAVFEVHLRLARAWLAACRGEVSAARSLALAAGKMTEASGQYAHAVVAVHDLARLGDPRVSWLTRLATLVDGPFAPACAAHAEALAARDGHRLDRAADSFGAMGANLLAAEAAAEAARCHSEEGRRTAMFASSTRSRRWLETCEGARSPVLAALTAPPLTPREREVATLAGHGLSNADIAERLVLSTRTAESHLQRAYAKLGVNSRAGLRAVLGLPVSGEVLVRPAPSA
jgi:ATP/maltotriose-dependent transcriptional regulator MalT